MSFYSSKPTTGQNLWSLIGVSEKDAKILTLWFNSTINLLQVYLQRIETRGTWMEINNAMINDFSTLNTESLEQDQKQMLLNFFEKTKNMEFPSILEQLKTGFAPRKELDMLLLQVIGYSKEKADQLLTRLYPALTSEIENLKLMMEG